MQRDPHDMSHFNSVPDLSAPKRGMTGVPPPSPLIRRLNDAGAFEAAIVNGVGIPARSDYLDGEELIDEITGACRQMVREELEEFGKRLIEAMIGAAQGDEPEPTTPPADDWNGPELYREARPEQGPPEPVKLRIPRTGPREA